MLRAIVHLESQRKILTRQAQIMSVGMKDSPKPMKSKQVGLASEHLYLRPAL